MRGILHDSLAEMLDRKIIWIYAAVTVIGILIVIAANSAALNFNGQELDLKTMGEEVAGPIMVGINRFAYVLVFLSVLATAGIFPKMMVKGRADYFLSKPISRGSLLISKMLSIWLVYSLLVTACVLVIWVVTGAVVGVFGAKLWMLLMLHVLSLLIWLSITITIGMVTGSNALSIMAAFVTWVLQQILVFHEEIGSFIDNSILRNAISGLYYIWPKTIQISDMVESAVMKGGAEWMPLYSSLIFAAAMTVLAVFIFRRKDY
ncbi:MAG TPA: ABC transporter permease subunit [candidate division Zixibacteria bacterium]|nr:ABC transporter permease subunit [candidate division Zixibacteria bacterium]